MRDSKVVILQTFRLNFSLHSSPSLSSIDPTSAASSVLSSNATVTLPSSSFITIFLSIVYR